LVPPRICCRHISHSKQRSDCIYHLVIISAFFPPKHYVCFVLQFTWSTSIIFLHSINWLFFMKETIQFLSENKLNFRMWFKWNSFLKELIWIKK
jgi:hypothetical protein